jgi:hypothetical protein
MVPYKFVVAVVGTVRFRQTTLLYGATTVGIVRFRMINFISLNQKVPTAP